MADDSSERFVLLNHLAEEFAARYRASERPSLQEYIDRHPELADDIREFFPTLVEMEQVKDDRQAPVKQAASHTLPPLERLGDFRILREIGHGGMGVVYEAEQVSLGRHVALKVLPKQMLANAQTKRRFQREARAAAKLHHTNIVPVFGVGEHEGLPYYVMQFIPGLGLDEVLEELQRLQPGKPGSGSSPRLSGGELRVSRKDVSAAAVARSLVTGRYTPAAEQPDEAPAARSDATAAHAPSPLPLCPPGERGKGEGAVASSPRADAPGSPNETPVAGRLSDTFSASSSSVVLPGSRPAGRQSGQKQLTYWQSVAKIGVQAADALEYAHRQGILHRDIKPSNLLLDTTGTVWVTDFGLAKADDQQDLTHTGDVLGTLRYMPPEAFDGKTDARSDVYALGLTLYELVAFRPAFDEKERNRLIKQVTTAEPARLDRLNREAPRDLATIVHKAIERDAAHRYATAAELEADLKRFLDDEPIQARRQTQLERYVRWARHHPGMAVLGGVLTAVLVLVTAASLLAAGYFNRAAQSERNARQEAVQSEARARAEAAKAKKAEDFLVSMFQKAERDEKGGNVTIRQLVQEADTRIPVEFADQPELRADLVKAIGEVKRAIGRRTPQAMILEVRGTVTLHSHEGEEKRVAPQALLNLDDRLRLGADGEVQLVFLSDLHKERLKAGREVTIDSRGCDPADAVRERDASVLMTFVRLPKGTFYMGWDGRPGSAKKTEIKEDFEIAVHDVTQGQWEAVMDDNPSQHSRNRAGAGRDVSDEELKLFPVERVSWYDAQAFINKLNETERVSGYRYRLPTQAEWEYACRGGATSEAECSYQFYFDRPTNDLSSEQANFDGEFPFGRAPKGKYLGRPTRVGAYPPNKLGLCDMHGNVWQWTADTFLGGSDRVYRGGSWVHSGSFSRAASFDWPAPTIRYNDVGFRLVRVPETAVSVGDMGDIYADAQDWKRAIAAYRRAITDQPADVALLTKLARAYQSAGLTREAIPYLAKASAANPEDTLLFQKVTALQAWFGQEKELADTCQKGLESAENTTVPETADRVGKACCQLPSTEKAQLEGALALARKAVDLGGKQPNLPYFEMALGMAEYRSGHFAEADAALIAAANGGTNNPHVAGTSAFYRAMSLFRQGKEDEARKLATAAAATMEPLPEDENNPLAGNAIPDDVILWLAYKEAKAMIGFDEAPPPKGEKDKR